MVADHREPSRKLRFHALALAVNHWQRIGKAIYLSETVRTLESHLSSKIAGSSNSTDDVMNYTTLTLTKNFSKLFFGQFPTSTLT